MSTTNAFDRLTQFLSSHPIARKASAAAVQVAEKLRGQQTHYDAEALEGFRRCQRLAYECATQISSEIREGWTEKQTAKLMDTWLQDHGVNVFFHKSFAWFGDRSGFEGLRNVLDFLPSDKRRYRVDNVAILDTAPILDGYAADIGYTFCRVKNPDFERAQKLLLKFRRELPALFASELTTQEIWTKIDEDIRAEGFLNRHKAYPFSVLAHRLHRMPEGRIPGATIPFSLHAYWALFSRGLLPELLGPEHEGSKLGLWAIEPHLGTANGPGASFGAKFEEILVVDETGARWLDDEVPHLKWSVS